MGTLQRILTSFFDAVLAPLEALGMEWVLILLSGAFGVFALWVFKRISPQRAIRRTKDLIKGAMIEIRIYQDDLRLVTRAIGRVLRLNLRYLALNVGPFVPLAFLFVLLAGQLVTRYAFDPIPVEASASTALAGVGRTLSIDWEGAGDLNVRFPKGLDPVSALVRAPEQGRAFQEFVATAPGSFEIEIEGAGETFSKRVWAGERAQNGHRFPGVQPARLSGWEVWLWPAEAGLRDGARIEFHYPDHALGWLPGSGPSGVLLNMLLFSMLFGFLAIKPLGVEI
ncbi:MAG: hypothetical protein KDB61_00120 [Planctomycetes bacterium]|nr:hypothetical protein [Planctomycetota bacterium]